MNVLTNHVKSVTAAIANIVRWEGYVVRNYALKSDLKIKWVRPEKIPSYKAEKSGDLGLNLNVKPSQLANHFDESIELKDADDIVKKLVTLEYLPLWETKEKKRVETLSLVKRHAYDNYSMEAKIAQMTTTIQHLQQRMELHPRDVKVKVFLKELIDKRKKFLGYLRRWDYRRFEWILEKLNLIYKAHPPQYLPVSRKDSLRKLTANHCENIVQGKLDAYKAELQAQQKEFFKEKWQKLVFVRNEELSCGVTPSVTEEDIEQAKVKYESFK
ncbi:28S ribosomal protein S15, mitochondrial [Athalia rosae]|uniref:28S ribosomal protein S15, mitochondrial n=1 Tax=Athalia rosae TaxID=37344 RepID=UPI0006261773|nr:28S ribosomal protein S15, mitochondrial [Athalia rosae]